MHRSISMLTVAALGVMVMACGSPEQQATAEAVRAAITAHIRANDDQLTVNDPRTGQPLILAFDYVHDGVEGTAGGRQVACVDYRAPDGTVFDIDYYVDPREGYQVEDVVVHLAGDEEVLSAQERERLNAAP
ncbi:MAG: hypothetical protein HY704_07820 [Gemmatimonadetes bacterium]|nr:hypothetical protein [Gemmatimonadota bacterium]